MSLSSDRVPVELDSRVTWLPRGGRYRRLWRSGGKYIQIQNIPVATALAEVVTMSTPITSLDPRSECPIVSDGVTRARMVADWPRIVLRVHNADNTNWGTYF